MFFELLPKCRGRIQCTSGRPMYTDSAMVPWRPRGVGGLQRLSTFLFLALFFWLVTPQKRDSIDGAEHHGDKTETEVKEMSVLREQLNSTRLQSVIKLKVNSDFFFKLLSQLPSGLMVRPDLWPTKQCSSCSSWATSSEEEGRKHGPPVSNLDQTVGNIAPWWARQSNWFQNAKKKYPEDKKKALIRQ